MAKIIPQGIDIQLSFSSYLQFSDCFPRWWGHPPSAISVQRSPPSCSQARQAHLQCQCLGCSPGSAVPESAFLMASDETSSRVCRDELLFCELLIYVQMLSISRSPVLVTDTHHSSVVALQILIFPNLLSSYCLFMASFSTEHLLFLQSQIDLPSYSSGYSGLSKPFLTALPVCWPHMWVLPLLWFLHLLTRSVWLLTLTHCGHSSYRRLSAAPAPQNWPILSPLLHEWNSPRMVTAPSISVLGQGLFAYS